VSATGLHPKRDNTTIAFVLPPQLIDQLAGLGAVLSIGVEMDDLPRQFKRCRDDYEPLDFCHWGTWQSLRGGEPSAPMKVICLPQRDRNARRNRI